MLTSLAVAASSNSTFGCLAGSSRQDERNACLRGSYSAEHDIAHNLPVDAVDGGSTDHVGVQLCLSLV